MKRIVVLSSLIVSALFACKREDGPLSPEAADHQGANDGDQGRNDPPVPPPTTDGGVTPPPEDPPVVPPPIEPPPRTKTYLYEENWTHAVAATLQSSYFPDVAIYRDTWDVSAHALGSLIDFMALSGSREYLHIVNKVYETNKTNNFITENYVFNILWANTWIRAYDLIGDKRYLETAKIIAEDLETNGWDASTCGGGLVASKTNRAKLGANTLGYAYINAALYNRVSTETKYLERAQKGWDFIISTNLLNGANLVSNGLTTACKNDGLQNWSHAQGYMIATAVQLNLATKKPEYLETAQKVAQAAMMNLSTEGVLREANAKKCGECKGEERILKGIFVRSLRELLAVTKDETIEKYLEFNIVKVWNTARSTGDAIGFHWGAAFDSTDTGRQAAALDLFNAALHSNDYKNISLNRVAQTVRDCAVKESGTQALDGSAMTKWCAAVGTGASLVIDLGSELEFHLIKILHGASGGEAIDSNTKAFTIGVSESPTGPWRDIETVTGNTSSATFHKVPNTISRYVRIHVTQGGVDGNVRIYEIVLQ